MIRFNLQFFGGRGSGSYSANAQFTSGGGGRNNARAIDLNVAGWTPEAGSRKVNINTTLNSVETRIQNNDHEQLIIIDRDGYVAAVVDGGGSSVGYTDKALAATRAGGIEIHNHPNTGTMFSGTDIISNGTINAREMRVVTSKGTTYSIKAGNRANAKGFADDMRKNEKRIIKQINEKLNNTVNKRKYANKDTYMAQVDRVYNEIMGAWISEKSKKYGYTFTSHKTGKN